ncbi:hypothetical protein CEJ90_15490, partial [Staphylococcus aureus]
LVILTIIGVLIGSMFPFAFLAQLISAGTLVAFMFVSLAMYRLSGLTMKVISRHVQMNKVNVSLLTSYQLML